jgi:hypothetical protein
MIYSGAWGKYRLAHILDNGNRDFDKLILLKKMNEFRNKYQFSEISGPFGEQLCPHKDPYGQTGNGQEPDSENCRYDPDGANYFSSRSLSLADLRSGTGWHRKFAENGGIFLAMGKNRLYWLLGGRQCGSPDAFQECSGAPFAIVIVMHHNPGFNFMAKFEMAGGVLQNVEQISAGMAINGANILFMPVDHDLNFNRQKNTFELVPLRERTKFRPEIDR